MDREENAPSMRMWRRDVTPLIQIFKQNRHTFIVATPSAGRLYKNKEEGRFAHLPPALALLASPFLDWN